MSIIFNPLNCTLEYVGVALAAVGSSPNTAGASIAGTVLTLQPADATRPGVVTAAAQTFGGVKTLTSPIFVTPALGTPASGVATNLTGTASGLTAGNVTTNANMTGDVTSVGNATTLTNAPVIAKVLTGFASGAGTVSATDSILTAIQKLDGNNGTNANLTGPITSVGNATSIASQTGTGTKFVVDTSPTLITPVLGVASGTSLNLSGLTVSQAVVTDGSKNLASLGYSSAATASFILQRDSSANSMANNFVFNLTNVVSAAGTTTLTIGSSHYQRITGSTTQTIVMPNGTTLSNGHWFEIANASTGVVTVNANDGSTLILTIPGGGACFLVLADNSTSNGSWSTRFYMPSNASYGTSGMSITGTLTASGVIQNAALTVSSAVATDGSKNLVSVTNTGSGNNVLATSPTLVTPILGIPSSGTLTSCTGLPISSGVSGLGSNVATFLGTPTSANLAAALTDETGSGANVFATSPVLVTPTLGYATLTAVQTAVGLLTDGATITPDFSSGSNFRVALGGNRTLANPSNPAAGQQGIINVFQDSTGSRTLAYGASYRFPNGVAPTLSTGKFIRDELSYYVDSYSTATITMTIAAPCVVTWTGHGFVSGQVVQFTTSGALPTGLSVSTNYWINVVDSNTFNVSTTFANLQAGTYITTTGSQSGTHTGTQLTVSIYANLGMA